MPHEGQDDSAETVPCPYCRRLIYEEAERCPYCEKYISEEDAPSRLPWWIVVGALLGLYAMYRLIIGG